MVRFRSVVRLSKQKKIWTGGSQMSRKRLVSNELLDLAAATAERLMDDVEGGARTMATSRVSEVKGGMIALETDYDWIPAFFVWYHSVFQHKLRRVS